MRLGPLFTSWEGTEEAVNAGVEEIGAQDRSGENLHELVARLDSRFETMSCYYVATVAASTVPPTLKASCPLSSFSKGSVPRYELYQHGSYGGAPPGTLPICGQCGRQRSDRLPGEAPLPHRRAPRLAPRPPRPQGSWCSSSWREGRRLYLAGTRFKGKGRGGEG